MDAATAIFLLATFALALIGCAGVWYVTREIERLNDAIRSLYGLYMQDMKWCHDEIACSAEVGHHHVPTDIEDFGPAVEDVIEELIEDAPTEVRSDDGPILTLVKGCECGLHGHDPDDDD